MNASSSVKFAVLTSDTHAKKLVGEVVKNYYIVMYV